MRWYRYGYDALNRITNATGGANSNYDVSNITYDKNGNILTLNRKGHTSLDGNGLVTGFGNMDILDYDYSGNQLTKVADTGNANYGFVDGTNQTTEYVYDANGSLKIDRNKGITDIEYNHMNLPTKVTINGNGNNGTIDYVYDATGVKQRKIVSNGTTTDYADGYLYENGQLQFFGHSEGYIEPKNPNDYSQGFDYIYQYKDHLANIRLSYSDDDGNGTIDPSTEIREENNVYPFGLEHKGYNNVINGTENNYQTFQGQEKEEELGKNTHAFQWRDYDPAIGRFNKIDRFSEKYVDASPYAYITNNPISFREIAGDSIQVFFKDKDGNRLNSVPKAVQKMFQEEFGISVGYNAETNMLYLDGEVDSELSQSESATGFLVDALTDTNTGKDADKHGTIIFGHNLKAIQNGDVEFGERAKAPPRFRNGVVQIDLADFDSKGRLRGFDYSSGLNPRSQNLARVFEHEYLGHQRLGVGGFADGTEFSMGRAVESTNLFRRERGLDERLNYGSSIIFFGSTQGYRNKGEQRRAVRKMISTPGTNNLFIKRKRRN